MKYNKNAEICRTRGAIKRLSMLPTTPMRCSVYEALKERLVLLTTDGDVDAWDEALGLVAIIEQRKARFMTERERKKLAQQGELAQPGELAQQGYAEDCGCKREVS